MDNEMPVVECWACKVMIAVPFLHGKPADTFKCGWCGALNELQQGSKLQHQHWQHQHYPRGPLATGHGAGNMQAVHTHSADAHKTTASGAFALHLPSAQQMIHSNRSSKFKCVMQCCSSACQQMWRWAIVVFVALLVGSIAGTGIWMLLPRLCTSWATYLPNLLFAALLLINVVCNYTAAVVQSPGKVTEWVPLPPRGPSGEVLQGSFYLYTYCKPCRSPKPPQAHHCRSCGHCVVDMDHHCPFIANCVGRGNLRPFLLFLCWTLLAATYTLLMCSILVWQQWEVVRSSVSLHAAQHNNSTRLGGRAGSVFSAPGFTSVPANFTGVLDVAAAGSQSSTGAGNQNGSTTLDMPGAAAPVAAAPGSSSLLSTSWLIASTGLFFVVLQLAPGWLLATYYLAAASAALLLAISVLLYSQLSYLARGLTYIQHLKGGAGAAGLHGHDAAQYEQQDVCGVGRSGDSSYQQQHMPYMSGASHSCESMLSAVQEGHSGWALHTGKAGKYSMLWLRVREVLDADSSVSSCLRATLLPSWRSSTTRLSTGTKKWT